LTDGSASDNPLQQIQTLYQKHRARNFILYTIGFGSDADMTTLNKLAVAGGSEKALTAANGYDLITAFENIAGDCQKALNGIVSRFANYVGSEVAQKIALDYL